MKCRVRIQILTVWFLFLSYFSVNCPLGGHLSLGGKKLELLQSYPVNSSIWKNNQAYLQMVTVNGAAPTPSKYLLSDISVSFCCVTINHKTLICVGAFNILHPSAWSEMKVNQACPTLCNPMDYTVHGILQSRILDWVAFPFSMGSSQSGDWNQISHVAGDSLPVEPQGKPKCLRKPLIAEVTLQLNPESSFGSRVTWASLLVQSSCKQYDFG